MQTRSTTTATGVPDSARSHAHAQELLNALADAEHQQDRWTLLSYQERGTRWACWLALLDLVVAPCLGVWLIVTAAGPFRLWVVLIGAALFLPAGFAGALYPRCRTDHRQVRQLARQAARAEQEAHDRFEDLVSTVWDREPETPMGPAERRPSVLR
ncbi:hypothetical protein FHX42_003655 [Saccharopolyspora lacisalsi]|uniref:Uncharacterized protein n=1 Tax=Halosaccharopolyspora lacisalsi TaxID=1000566 RepID=A0A839E033_9PSEU|nr:hypothetical protein [Halosaccharopolyspora lacisalsi]MBA8826279.1 hypothetical protein [Halosaccharopolyspora lacisalsi]